MNFKAITLSNGKKYIITNELRVNNKLYYQILCVDNDSDFEIVENKNDEIVFIDDVLLKTKILTEMCKNIQE
ncbi:MAG: hypothetical protein E7345_01560 [Clostridiales bacterium]|nr:hypothetical protein [Clostridiales bacterium]